MRTALLGVARQINGLFCRIGTGPGNHGNPPFRRFNTGIDQALMFRVVKSWCFTRCPARNEPMSAAGDMPFNKILKGVNINLPFFKGGHERHNGTFERCHPVSPLSVCKISFTLPAILRRSKWISILTALLLFSPLPAFSQNQAFDSLRNNPDPVAAKLMIWLDVTTTPRPKNVKTLIDFTIANADWPKLHEFRARIEKDIAASLRPHGIAEWFNQVPPESYAGIKAYTGALLRLDHPDKAKTALRKFWLVAELNKKETEALSSQYKKLFSPTDFIDRLDALLWENRYQEAEYMLPLVDAGHRKLAEARISLGRLSSKAPKLVRAVPAALQNDAGLLFDRLTWRRKMNKDPDALEILRRAPKNAPHPELWWRERNILARRAIEKENYAGAYKIISTHGLIPTTFALTADYSQAEWLSGWLALRFLHQPDKAYRHFDRFYQVVTSAVSRSRAAWWLARASESLHKTESASNWDKLGAQFPSTFYGQLSFEKLHGISYNAQFLDDQTSPEAKRHFEGRSLVRAVRLLAHAGLPKYADPFFVKLLEQAKDRSDFVLIAKLARAIDRSYYAVESNKQLQQKLGSFMFTEGYPLLPALHVQEPESALIHAIVHRESMFDSMASSPAGARGLMQLMPATARQISRNIGKRFTLDKLHDDPRYNIELGAAYLQSLLEAYDGFYPLAIAAYNAGPGNVNLWLRKFGDPRRGKIGIVDWIELIPIYETRNYVQRVMESYYIYKLKLSETPKTVMGFGEIGKK